MGWNGLSILHKQPKRHYCCDTFAYHATFKSDTCASPFACPDTLLIYNPKKKTYGLIIHDGGESYIQINHCPWCGKKL